MTPPRVYLSSPHMSGEEAALVQDVFASNWVAPLGPHVDAFEKEFAARVGSPHAAALSSGTAGLHLAMILAGVSTGDDVVVSTLTFSASVNPICYLGARPVFVDSDRASWNMDPAALEALLKERAAKGRVPKALILVHLYGQSADIDTIAALCARYGVTLIEDAAEALGATYKGRSPGTTGRFGVFSFNGNKIITTAGGGMLVGAEEEAIAHARRLASQAREPAPHYEHAEIGYNYRLSNVLAAIGRAQLTVLEDRVAARRANFARYAKELGNLPGIAFMPEAPWGGHTRWLTTLTIDPARFGADREQVRLALEKENIESRPLWKPMHLQPVFREFPCASGTVAEALFRDGLCLPSGSNLAPADLERVVHVVRSLAR